MKIKQLKAYKKALEVLEKAEVTTDKSGSLYWVNEKCLFEGLCYLIRNLSQTNTKVITQFKRDSEVMLGKELYEGVLWFTQIDYNEPKARQERINHLKNLIKLYEDGTGRDI